MKVKVRLFAGAAAAAGRREWTVELPEDADAGAAVAALRSAIPALAELLPRCAFALDRTYVGLDARLHPGAELAVIPPVSGGAGPDGSSVADRPCGAGARAPGRDVPAQDVAETDAGTGVAAGAVPSVCSVTIERLRIDPLLDHVNHPGAGGVVVFCGNVRGVTGADRTVRLEYDAYPQMAEEQLRQIVGEAAERWPGARLAVAHRVGVLAPGETAVVVAASAPHRAAAFEAARYAIDSIKDRVPIWKREVFDDGRSLWVEHA